jgi:sugar O-acyltransferase (sialic acid O-acetyltransferase NeuD family)
MKKLLIMGANNPEIIRLVDGVNRAAPSDPIQIVGFIDNDPGKIGSTFLGHPVLGSPEILSNPDYQDCFVINNITRDCATRKLTTEQLEHYPQKFLSLVHSSVDMNLVDVGRGLVVHEGCIISPRVRLEDHSALMIGSQIAHDCHVEKYCFIGPKANICGGVHLAAGAFVGAGAIILPNLVIGAGAKIGAGTVVMLNAPPGALLMGNPARVIPQ